MRRACAAFVAIGGIWACTGFGSSDSGTVAAVVDAGGPDGNVLPGTPGDFSISFQKLSETRVVQGQSAKVLVTVVRGRDAQQPVVVTVGNLPPTVHVDPLTITGDTGELVVHVDADAVQGRVDGSLFGQSDAENAATPLNVLVRGPSGALDTTFGNAGTVSGIMGDPTEVVDAALLPDGSVLILGRCDVFRTVCVAHVTADGKVDKAYGGNNDGLGRLAIQHPVAAAVQSDGKFVVVGGPPPLHADVGRLDAAGAPDKSFGDGSGGGDGTLEFHSATTAQSAFGVALRKDGDIFVTFDVGPASAFGILRLAPAGVIRTTYGTQGWSSAGLYGGGQEIGGMPIAIGVRDVAGSSQDGNPFVIGISSKAPASLGMAQVDATSGAYDTSFAGGAGRVSFAFGGGRNIASFVQAPDGTVYMPVTNGAFYVAAFRADGTLPSNFGTAVVPPTPGLAAVSGSSGAGEGIARQADGKLIVTADGQGGEDIFRLSVSGVIDPSFGNAGNVHTTVGTTSAGRRVFVLPDGRILSVGQETAPVTDATVVRYWD